MISLAGQTAIITGGNQGLGKVLSQIFWQAGANIVMCARNESLLASAQHEILATSSKGHERLSYLAADVSVVEATQGIVDYTLKKHGRIDILINNAGVYGPKGCLEDVDWQEWKNAIEINLYGPVLMCRAILPHFKKNGKGKIINLSGGGATAPLPSLSAYAAAKAALVRVTETLAAECKDDGIDINAIAPGALNTRLLDEILEAGPEKVGQSFYDRSVKQKTEGGASMETAAALCLYLASDDSNGITGKLLSSLWDPWQDLTRHLEKLRSTDIYTLRRIVPEDRDEDWQES
jgi:NAD(P)-dependent dehydrogenase (short-subunit alcohol dehydrogenase family)